MEVIKMNNEKINLKNRALIGLILIDTPHSALNNAGTSTDARTEILVEVKKIKVWGKEYPYVSGQAFRYWWRTALLSIKEWIPSPLTREEKIAYIAANPIKYEEDDVFGYMRAEKKGGKDITLTRVSPLKCSPLVSILSGVTATDMGVLSRQEGNPVPYYYQLYSTILKGIFSLHLEEVGKFYSKNRSGYKNLNEDLKNEALQKGAKEVDGIVYLKPEERIKRITDTIEVLPYLYGGAKQAVAHTDVSPKLIIMAVLSSPNPIFMNIVGEKEGKVIFNVEGFKQILKDYADKVLSPIFIGYRKGFLPNIEADIESLIEADIGSVKSNTTLKIEIVSPKDAVVKMSEWMKTNLKF
ncbi:type I-B CRISPR-associated protein Cas7/Cst2/DevR [Candidatus Woesearchaeota archaeon]|nr:type I-B CRISPR-associated protein Cas7/Cst2/DevR [Candidatus Woesearchaeota archaeon]